MALGDDDVLCVGSYCGAVHGDGDRAGGSVFLVGCARTADASPRTLACTLDSMAVEQRIAVAWKAE